MMSSDDHHYPAETAPTAETPEEFSSGFEKALSKIYSEVGRPNYTGPLTIARSAVPGTTGRALDAVGRSTAASVCIGAPTTTLPTMVVSAAAAASSLPLDRHPLAPPPFVLRPTFPGVALVDPTQGARPPMPIPPRPPPPAAPPFAGRSAPPGSAAPIVDQRQSPDPKRLKNRAAAQRCRNKKMEQAVRMRERVTDVGRDNEELRTKVALMREKINELEQTLEPHRNAESCRVRYSFVALQ